jgi:hypothetical protein
MVPLAYPVGLKFQYFLKVGARRRGDSAASPLSINGKSLVKPIGGTFLPVSAPQFVFVAIPPAPGRSGVVDVLDVLTLSRVDATVFHPGSQAIPAPGVTGLMDYFRQ